MGKSKKGNKTTTRVTHHSSGLKKLRDRARHVRRLKMKIRRWNANKNKVSKKNPGKSRGNWNTTGMLKQLAFVESL